MPFGVIRNIIKNITRATITNSDNVKSVIMFVIMSGKELGNFAVGSSYTAAFNTMFDKITTIYFRMLLQQLPDKVVRVKLCVEVADNL